MKAVVVAAWLVVGAVVAQSTPAFCDDDVFETGEWKTPDEPVYDARKPVPAGYVVEKQPRRGLLIGGVATLGASYGLGLLIAVRARQDPPENFTFSPGWMLIPVIGPWIAAATAHDKCQYGGWGPERRYHCLNAGNDRQALALLGGVQAVGVLMGAAAYKFPSKRWVRSSLSASVVPAGLGGYGLSIAGRL